MKLFENKFFIFGIFLTFFILLILVGVFGCFFGIVEIPNLIANSVLMLLSTFLAVAFPLYAASKYEERTVANEKKDIYMNVASYVGGEILDNQIEIQDVLANNQKVLGELNDSPLPENEKQKVRASVWKAAADSLVDSLQEKHHNSIVMSGIITKVPDRGVRIGIRDTYQKMDNLKKRLSSMSKFFSLLLSSQTTVPQQFINIQLTTKVPQAIKAVELDMDIFNTSAERTIARLNKILIPYDEELKIVKYEGEEPKEGIGETKKGCGKVATDKNIGRKNI